MKKANATIRSSKGKITLTSNLAMFILVLVASERFYDKFWIKPDVAAPNGDTYVLYSVKGETETQKKYWDFHYMDGNLDGYITSGEAKREHDFTWVTMDKTKPIYDLLKTCSEEDKVFLYGLSYPVAIKAIQMSETEKNKLLKLDLVTRVNTLNSLFL